jgi:hypothetical protein
MKVNYFLIFISLLLSNFVSADDFGIAMPDQINDSGTLNDAEGKEFHLIGERDELKTSGNKKSFAVQDSVDEANRKLTWKQKLLGSGVTEPFKYENNESELVIKNNNIYNKIYNKGESGFGFAYIQDGYTIKDSEGVFQRTYERSTGSVRGGTIHFEFDQSLYKGFIDFSYGLGVGVGFSKGKGSFRSNQGQESDTTFSLFTLPLDLRLVFDIIETRFFKVSLAGGPSAMGLYQSRNDLDEGEEGKRVRQYSFGYFGQAKLKISMASFDRNIIISNFLSRNVTNMYLDLEARVQNYEKFQDNLSITGSSFGIGFSFDYL